MKPSEHFSFCPKCGEPTARERKDPFCCHKCKFTYYFNPASAAAVFVTDPEGRVLFIRRAKPPAQGKLAVPGGFVDHGENAEAGLRREIREEVNLEVPRLRYLCSQPNEYPYKGVTYTVLDLYFVGQAEGETTAAALDGVESCCWLEPSRVDPNELAFTSLRAAFDLYVREFNASTPGA
jgi:NAD+ diphosphatase